MAIKVQQKNPYLVQQFRRRPVMQYGCATVVNARGSIPAGAAAEQELGTGFMAQARKRAAGAASLPI